MIPLITTYEEHCITNQVFLSRGKNCIVAIMYMKYLKNIQNMMKVLDFYIF